MAQSNVFTESRPHTFEEFWPIYLSFHAKPMTRIFHFIGTMLQIPIIAAAITTGRWYLIFLVPVVSYGFAWFSHFVFERNKPATFNMPLYSLIGDYKMVGLMLTGRLWTETP